MHSLIGLSALELQGIDNETVVLVVEERLPQSDRSITYGLILDLAKLRMDLCASLTEKGLLFFPEDRALWTPKHIQEQWDQIKERLRALTDEARINPKYTETNREITVLPLKRGLYGSSRAVEFYNTLPDRNQIKSTTHFFIIGVSIWWSVTRTSLSLARSMRQTKPRPSPSISFLCLRQRLTI